MNRHTPAPSRSHWCLIRRLRAEGQRLALGWRWERREGRVVRKGERAVALRGSRCSEGHSPAPAHPALHSCSCEPFSRALSWHRPRFQQLSAGDSDHRAAVSAFTSSKQRAGAGPQLLSVRGGAYCSRDFWAWSRCRPGDGRVAVTSLPNCPHTQTHPSPSPISLSFDVQTAAITCTRSRAPASFKR